MAVRIEVLAGHHTYLFWAGEGAMTDANAIFYVKRDGSSYFGGSLSAGFLRTSANSSIPTHSGSVETGEFDTNGNPKNVAASVSFANGSFWVVSQQNPAIGPKPIGGTLYVDRKLPGGSWVNLPEGTTSITGTWEVGNEGVERFENVYASASVSFTDNSANAGPFQYRVRAESNGNWPVIFPGGSMGTYHLGITVTEY